MYLIKFPNYILNFPRLTTAQSIEKKEIVGKRQNTLLKL